VVTILVTLSVAFMANMVLPPADFSAINAIVAIGQRLITQRPDGVRILTPLPIIGEIERKTQTQFRRSYF
jgi:hypothetical protein